MEPSQDNKPSASYEALGVAWSFGWPIAAGVVLGTWVDGQFGTSPAGTLVFSIGAFAGSVRRLLRLPSHRDAGEKS